MFRIFYAEQDATLYESAATYNTGLDPVLEIGKRLNTSGSNYLKSRSVIKFDMTEISSSLSKYNKTVNDCKFVLQLYTSDAKALPAQYTVTAKMVGQDWMNGTGYLSSLTTDGVSWEGPESGSSWISGSQKIEIGTSDLYISGSGTGGNYLYYSGSSTAPVLQVSESFSYRTSDVNLNVTQPLKIWLSGSSGQSIPNYGFMIQFSDSDESNDNVHGYVRFFSRDTHTIYVPKLTMYWDDTSYSTGSMSEINLESYATYTNTKSIYKDTEIAKIRIYARDKYPRKSPTNVFPYELVKVLPDTTYYSVVDAATDEVIIPFDDIYTKVSCDSTSNFIYLDFNGLMPERSYRLQLKIVDGFIEQYIDDQIYFKVVR